MMFTRITWVVFILLAGLFIVAAPLENSLPFSADFRDFVPYLSILGAILIAVTLPARITRPVKAFLIVNGASAVGWSVAYYVHNPLLRVIPGEPFTYVLFFFVFPVTFVIGGIGAIILGLRQLFLRK